MKIKQIGHSAGLFYFSPCSTVMPDDSTLYLQTQQKICVTYSAPAFCCRRQLRVLPPAQRGAQRILDVQWHCDPPPDEARESVDDFGNRVLHLHHRRIARQFDFGLQLKIACASDAASRTENLPPQGLGAFLLPSALCDSGALIREKAQQIRDDKIFQSLNAMQKAQHLNRLAHHTLKYVTGVTDENTTASEALRQGAGVCQDFAHLFIALCRQLGFAARYISGFNPTTGIMHAWAEALLNERWHAFDPTHQKMARRDCIVVACGRDYRDVLPHEGTFHGSARATLRLHCRTQPFIPQSSDAI